MFSVVGIFPGRVPAGAAVQALVGIGVPPQAIIFLSGESAISEAESVPTTDAEADGMGKTMGAVVGGSAGVGAGLALGSAVASLMVPGVGPIMAAGLGAAAVLGLGGAAAGAKVGDESEHSLDTGIPRDDVLFYRDLLKRGRSIVIANLQDEEKADAARGIFERQGSEDVNAARAEWKNAA